MFINTYMQVPSIDIPSQPEFRTHDVTAPILNELNANEPIVV